MIDAPDLTKLSHAEKDALILALLRQLAGSEARIAALEARLAALTGPAMSTAVEKPAKWRRKSLPVLVGFPCSVGGRFLVPA